MQDWLAKQLNCISSPTDSEGNAKPYPDFLQAAACGTCMDSFSEFATALIETLPHPVLLLDASGNIQSCNSAANGMVPELAQVLTEATLEWFLKKAGLPMVIADWPLEQVREDLVELKGNLHMVRLRPLVFRGEIAGSVFGIGEEVYTGDVYRDLRSARIQLQELSSCIEISSDGFCIMDNNTTILFVNHVYEKITGLKRKAIIGRTMRELVRQGVFDRSTSEKILEHRCPVTLTLNLRTGKSVLCSGSPLFDENNNVSRIVCSIRDVTELNRLQSELDSVATLKTRYEEELVGLKMRSSDGSNIIFRSKGVRRIIELALRLGSVDSTILLHSESGSGKELLADFIQKNSLRSGKPYLKINCGAIPEHLLESELFGYVRGAFTGANREGKVGLFEAANGGTLLLDEVGDLPKPLQVKLLRVLQEKVVRRIGETTSREVNVRVLASTNRILAEMVERGEFREDLFYRLNVVPITIPPLRQRKEDILPLVQAFLEKFNKRYNTQKALHPRLMPVLLAYPWPGNVRELENIIERLVVTSIGRLINETDMPKELLWEAKGKFSTLPVQGKKLKEIMDDYESLILRQYLSEYRTTREMAAALGIHQSNVVRKLQRLNIEDVLQI